MDFLRRLLNLEGVGTELGVLNLVLLTVFAGLAGWVLKWRWREAKTILAQHREMYRRHDYRKQKDASSGLQLSAKDQKTTAVSELLKGRDK